MQILFSVATISEPGGEMPALAVSSVNIADMCCCNDPVQMEWFGNGLLNILTRSCQFFFAGGDRGSSTEYWVRWGGLELGGLNPVVFFMCCMHVRYVTDVTSWM